MPFHNESIFDRDTPLDAGYARLVGDGVRGKAAPFGLLPGFRVFGALLEA